MKHYGHVKRGVLCGARDMVSVCARSSGQPNSEHTLFGGKDGKLVILPVLFWSVLWKWKKVDNSGWPAGTNPRGANPNPTTHLVLRSQNGNQLLLRELERTRAYLGPIRLRLKEEWQLNG
jgi:hypothetical protein